MPSIETIDCNRQQADLLPIAQLSDAVAQEWFEGDNLFAERFQPYPPDLLSLALGDDEGALPIIPAVKQDEHFPGYYVPEGLPWVGRKAADSHPKNIHGRA